MVTPLSSNPAWNLRLVTSRKYWQAVWQDRVFGMIRREFVAAVVVVFLRLSTAAGSSVGMVVDEAEILAFSGDTDSDPRALAVLSDGRLVFFEDEPGAGGAEDSVILADYSGHAGALEHHGSGRGLPPVYSPMTGNFLWGPPEREPTTVISIGIDEGFIRENFERVRQAAVFRCSYCPPVVDELPIYVATGPRRSFEKLWPEIGRPGDRHSRMLEAQRSPERSDSRNAFSFACAAKPSNCVVACSACCFNGKRRACARPIRWSSRVFVSNCGSRLRSSPWCSTSRPAGGSRSGVRNVALRRSTAITSPRLR